MKYKFCPRDDQCYYGVVDPSLQPQELWTLASKILNELDDAGLNQKAVDVLNNAGLKAQRLKILKLLLQIKCESSQTPRNRRA